MRSLFGADFNLVFGEFILSLPNLNNAILLSSIAIILALQPLAKLI